MAPRTLSRFTLDLMLDAVPYSSANIFDTRDIWSPEHKIYLLNCCHRVGIPGGMMSEIILVPFPLASSRDLMSFLTFQISTFLSACSAVSLIISQISVCETKTNSEIEVGNN